MRKLIYTILALAVATSVARAEPSLSAELEPPAAPQQFYAAGGMLFGADTSDLFDAASVEGGYHLRGPLWAHAMIVEGEMRDLRDPVDASAYLQLRGGVETRGCIARGYVCGISGADLAFAHERVEAGSYMSRYDGAQVVPRAMLDLGTKHVRLRPGIEAMIDGHGFDGLGITGALAFVW